MQWVSTSFSAGISCKAARICVLSFKSSPKCLRVESSALLLRSSLLKYAMKKWTIQKYCVEECKTNIMHTCWRNLSTLTYGTVKQSSCRWRHHLEMYRHSSSTFTENGHITFISTEYFDVILYPSISECFSVKECNYDKNPRKVAFCKVLLSGKRVVQRSATLITAPIVVDAITRGGGCLRVSHRMRLFSVFSDRNMWFVLKSERWTN